MKKNALFQFAAIGAVFILAACSRAARLVSTTSRDEAQPAASSPSVEPTATAMSSAQTRIISVERVKSFGVAPAIARAGPGNDILLIGIETKEDISPFGNDLVLTDNTGNHYAMMGLFEGKYIFEVPETAEGLVLVVKDATEVPLP